MAGLPIVNGQPDPRDGSGKLGIESGSTRFGRNAGMATSMHQPLQSEEPWFGYYWGPTHTTGKVWTCPRSAGREIRGGAIANANAEIPDAAVTEFATAPLWTVVTKDFQTSHPRFRADVPTYSSRRTKMRQPAGMVWTRTTAQQRRKSKLSIFLTNNTGNLENWINDGRAQEPVGALLGRLIRTTLWGGPVHEASGRPLRLIRL